MRAQSQRRYLSTSSTKKSNDMMLRAPFLAPRHSQGKTRRKKQKSKWFYFSFVGERAPFLQRQRKMMARDAVARAPPCRARSGNKTQQSKRELRADIPRKDKTKETTIKMVLFFFRWGEGAISPAPKKDDRARCCGEGASSVPQRARVKHNNKLELIFHFYIPPTLTSCHHLQS